jgi:hypothetical protein
MQIFATGAASPPTTPTSPASSPSSGPTAGPAAPADSAVQNFLNLVGSSPAQQMRDQILRSMGLTENQLNAMSPQDRAKIEEKIKEMIQHKVEQSVEKQTGVVIDLKA